jgi:hypothetical protein
VRQIVEGLSLAELLAGRLTLLAACGTLLVLLLASVGRAKPATEAPRRPERGGQ